MSKKLSLISTIFFLCLSLMAQPTESANGFAEQMPYFIGCSDLENGTIEKRNCSNQNLITFINRNIQYPQVAQENGVEGTVLVKFVVNTFGRIEGSEVLREIGGNCGKEALRIVAMMPDWEPAIQDGKAVEVSLNLPITFSLANTDILVKDKYQIQWGSLRNERTSREDLKKLLSKKLYVRDELGNEVSLSKLTLIYHRKRSFREESSSGRINNKMVKLIKKVKKGGVFIIVAVIQRKGKAYEIEREFKVME